MKVITKSTRLVVKSNDSEAVMVDRYMHKLGMTHDEATQLYSDVVQMLDLANTKNVSPTPRVDKGWHEFILHTRMYADFCRERYGRFVHHTPNGNMCDGNCGSDGDNDGDDD